MSKIGIINGPNLNLLGVRQPEIYGDVSFSDYFHTLKKKYATIEMEYFQTNHEGSIIDKLHEWGFTFHGIVLNAGGYTHTSIALADAISSIDSPVIEVHISDIYTREKFRHISYLKEKCLASIVGKGLAGYDEAIQLIIDSNG